MDKDQNIAYLILAFIVVLFILFVFFVSLILIFTQRLKQKKKDAMQNLLDGVENEKQKISRDLHDHIVPGLAGLNFKLDKLCNGDEYDIDKKEIKTKLLESISEIRVLSHNLVSHALERYGLTEGIRDYSYNSPLKQVKIEVNDKAKDVEINKDVAQHIFAIFKELHMNTIKHSDATQCQVVLEINTTSLLFTYFDNGTQLAHKIKEGIGLYNIKSRVEIMDGKLSLNTEGNFFIEIRVNNVVKI